MSDTGVEAVKPDPGSSWEGHSKGGLGSGVGYENAEPCGVFCPLHIPLVIRPLRCTYVLAVRKTGEMLCGGYKWVSWFEAPCVCTRWMVQR